MANPTDRSRTLSIADEGGAAVSGRETISGAVDLLLATKLEIPPARSVLISRPRLMERLQAGLHGPLTVLSAPAGSGKSTLLSAWRATPEGQETSLAWIALDGGDNDPTRFWRYVLTALDRAIPGVGSAALALLGSSDASSMEAVLVTLVNALASQGMNAVLILDDYHVIEAEAIHQMLAFLLERRPPSLHLLLATRADPPLPLARLRAGGEVTELRAADLRFTMEETASFLGTVMGLTLPPREVAALEARTEGWIAGLQLAGLSLQGRSADDAATFIADFTGSHRYIVDYLLDEVLGRQPNDVQRFLLYTCILDRLCAPLCAAVLADEDHPAKCIADSQAILEALERNNVFLIALDEERRWFRYHYLFADALCQRQRGHAAIPEASILHRRASAWFEQQDLVEEAISHALAGGDYDGAADLLPQAIRPVTSRGKTWGLTAWLRALPEALLRARPELSFAYAWVLIELRDLRRAEEYLHHAEVVLETRPDAYSVREREFMRAVIEADRALISVLQGDVDGAIVRAQAVLDELAGIEGRTRTITANSARSISGIGLGLAHLSRGAAREAADAFGGVTKGVAEDISSATVVNRPTDTAPFLIAFLAAAGEASAHRLAGELDLARLAYEETIQWSEDHSHICLLAGNLYTGLADILREQNELDVALERATQGIRIERELGVAGSERWLEWNMCNLLVLARIKQAQGDLAGSLAVIHGAQEQLVGSNAAAFAAILAAFEAQLHLAQGDVEAAVRWITSAEAHQAPPRSGPTPPFFVYACEHLEIAPIQVLIAQGRASGDPASVRRARTRLDRLRARVERSELTWLRIKSLILQALASDVLGEQDSAQVALHQALALARPKGHIRVFLDEGPPLAELLRRVHTRDTDPDYVATLVGALESCSPQDIPRAAPLLRGESSGVALNEPLTEREIEVLRLLAVGQSNPEIARALYVELNTVKTHVKNLYGKLAVHSRMEAARRARELALL